VIPPKRGRKPGRHRFHSGRVGRRHPCTGAAHLSLGGDVDTLGRVGAPIRQMAAPLFIRGSLPGPGFFGKKGHLAAGTPLGQAGRNAALNPSFFKSQKSITGGIDGAPQALRSIFAVQKRRASTARREKHTESQFPFSYNSAKWPGVSRHR